MTDVPMDVHVRALAFKTPHAYFVTGEDNLRITSYNATASVQLTVSGRFLTLAGCIVPFQRQHTPNTDRTAARTLIALGEGWILDAVISGSAAAQPFGSGYAQLEIVRGLSGATVPLALIAQGFVSTVHPLVFPGASGASPLDVAGYPRSITGTNPAAATEIAETVPTGARWDLLAINFGLATDANVANREVNLVIDDGTNTLFQRPAGVAQTASSSWGYNYTRGVQLVAPSQTLAIAAPLPEFTLLAGYRIRTITTNIQAADNYVAPQLYVREQLDPQS